MAPRKPPTLRTSSPAAPVTRTNRRAITPTPARSKGKGSKRAASTLTHDDSSQASTLVPLTVPSSLETASIPNQSLELDVIHMTQESDAPLDDDDDDEQEQKGESLLEQSLTVTSSDSPAVRRESDMDVEDDVTATLTLAVQNHQVVIVPPPSVPSSDPEIPNDSASSLVFRMDAAELKKKEREMEQLRLREQQRKMKAEQQRKMKALHDTDRSIHFAVERLSQAPGTSASRTLRALEDYRAGLASGLYVLPPSPAKMTSPSGTVVPSPAKMASPSRTVVPSPAKMTSPSRTVVPPSPAKMTSPCASVVAPIPAVVSPPKMTSPSRTVIHLEEGDVVREIVEPIVEQKEKDSLVRGADALRKEVTQRLQEKEEEKKREEVVVHHSPIPASLSLMPYPGASNYTNRTVFFPLKPIQGDFSQTVTYIRKNAALPVHSVPAPSSLFASKSTEVMTDKESDALIHHFAASTPASTKDSDANDDDDDIVAEFFFESEAAAQETDVDDDDDDDDDGDEEEKEEEGEEVDDEQEEEDENEEGEEEEEKEENDGTQSDRAWHPGFWYNPNNKKKKQSKKKSAKSDGDENASVTSSSSSSKRKSGYVRKPLRIDPVTGETKRAYDRRVKPSTATAELVDEKGNATPVLSLPSASVIRRGPGRPRKDGKPPNSHKNTSSTKDDSTSLPPRFSVHVIDPPPSYQRPAREATSVREAASVQRKGHANEPVEKVLALLQSMPVEQRAYIEQLMKGGDSSKGSSSSSSSKLRSREAVDEEHSSRPGQQKKQKRDEVVVSEYDDNEDEEEEYMEVEEDEEEEDRSAVMRHDGGRIQRIITTTKTIIYRQQ
jgi:hypothetical protein